MLLAVDIGNTSITFGIFDKDILKKTFRMTSSESNSPEDYEKFLSIETAGFKISSSIISSVSDEIVSIFLKNAIYNIFKIESIFVSNSMNLEFKLNVDSPEAVGADRISNAAYASKFCNFPVIIVDIGTATTFDILDKNGDFTGGIIMPGIGLQMESLYKKTSKLPLVDLTPSENLIGRNTKDSILSGVLRGHACAIEGLIEQCIKELGENTNVVFTGGYSDIITGYMKNKSIEINKNVTLYGLQVLSELNQ